MKIKRTFLDLDDGVGDTVQLPADALQLGQSLLQPVSGPLTVSQLHQQCVLKPPDVPVHPVQSSPAVLDVLRHLLLDFVQLGDDLIFGVPCRGTEHE